MSSTIDRIDCWVLRAPITEPVANAFGAMTNRPAVFVRITASDGVSGWGEVFSNFPQVGAEHRARLLASIFAPLLKGFAADDPRAVRAMLDTRTRQMAIQCGEPGPFAQITGAVDQALWDMAARRAGLPLWKHLGGASGKVRVYASGIGPDKVVDVVLAKRAQGYAAFKLKVGFGTARDVANLSAERAALGDDAVIMCDANQAWSPQDAPARIAELAPLRPYWIEEPIGADQPHAAWAGLAKASAVPLAAGENLRGQQALEEALRAGYLGFVQPDVGKWGGVGGGLAVARVAQELGVPALAGRRCWPCGVDACAGRRVWLRRLGRSRCQSEPAAGIGVPDAGPGRMCLAAGYTRARCRARLSSTRRLHRFKLKPEA